MIRRLLIVAMGVCLFGHTGVANDRRSGWAGSVHSRQGWRAEVNMLYAVNRAAAAALDGRMYVAGGLDSNNYYTAAFQSYDPSTNTWSNLAPMPEARYYGDGMGVINGKFYVPGGWNGPLPTDTLYVYDPAFGWTTKAHMPHLSGCGASGVIDSKLYVLTPCNGFSGVRSLFDVYDPLRNSWTSLKPAKGAFQNVAAAVVNGKLYLAGGQSTNGTLTGYTEVYDPAANAWTRLGDMPTPVELASGVELDGKLWVLGGSDASGNAFSIVQVYDPVENKWRASRFLLPAATYAGVAAPVDGVIFLAGGAASGGTVGTTAGLFVLPSIP